MSADDEPVIIVIHDKILEEHPSPDPLHGYIAVAIHLIIFLCMVRLYVDG